MAERRPLAGSTIWSENSLATPASNSRCLFLENTEWSTLWSIDVQVQEPLEQRVLRQPFTDLPLTTR